MAILNLVVNARDAMLEGGTLTISAHCDGVDPDHPSRLPTGQFVRLAIADTGAGMDDATMARAREPFFSTKAAGTGTGLGLSMADGLVSQLGGALTLLSRPGLGTTVALFFPVSAESIIGVQAAAAVAAAVQAAGRVLLVDDEHLARSSTAAMLIDIGYDVIEAESAEEALNCLDREARIDGVITDHPMAGMTGVDLARAVRDRRPGTPVLIISGNAQVAGQVIDLPLLAKPFRQSNLAATLAVLLHQTAK